MQTAAFDAFHIQTCIIVQLSLFLEHLYQRVCNRPTLYSVIEHVLGTEPPHNTVNNGVKTGLMLHCIEQLVFITPHPYL